MQATSSVEQTSRESDTSSKCNNTVSVDDITGFSPSTIRGPEVLGPKTFERQGESFRV